MPSSPRKPSPDPENSMTHYPAPSDMTENILREEICRLTLLLKAGTATASEAFRLKECRRCLQAIEDVRMHIP